MAYPAKYHHLGVYKLSSDHQNISGSDALTVVMPEFRLTFPQTITWVPESRNMLSNNINVLKQLPIGTTVSYQSRANLTPIASGEVA